MAGSIEPVEKIEDLSGWILPDGTWHPCEDWWHIPVLYDLRDEGFAELCTEEAKGILNGGEEENIRNFAASLGFVRVSRRMLDGRALSPEQLATLQCLLEICDLDSEIGVLGPDPKGPVRHLSVERILKARNPGIVIPTIPS